MSPSLPPISRQEPCHKDGLVVIHVALFRMATRSLAEAYRILGYKVHHGLDDVMKNRWNLIEQAAESTWPTFPGARPRKRFTREDWDSLWGSEYDIATDLSSPFVDQLIEAYPNAKVVIIQREFEPWFESFKEELLEPLFSPTQRVLVFLLTHVLGIRAGPAMTKLHLGFFNVKSSKEIEKNARAAYGRYYEKIRSMVPPEKRLEYKIGDGWEPLCEFLGEPVPDLPFPRLNNRKEHSKGNIERRNAALLSMVKKTSPLLLFASILAVSWVYGRVGR